MTKAAIIAHQNEMSNINLSSQMNHGFVRQWPESQLNSGEDTKSTNTQLIQNAFQ